MARKSTGKRQRFEVFKRDHFTCQYCGAQPPDVVLVVDHIHPVAAGGGNETENLITACEACNQGKRDKPLGDVAIRPDADLMFLEAQQEIAELRRYQVTKAERDKVLAEIIEGLEQTWQEITGLDWVPATSITRSLLSRYDPEIVELAMIDVAGKVSGGYLKTHNGKWVAYLNAVARNIAAQREDEIA